MVSTSPNFPIFKYVENFLVNEKDNFNASPLKSKKQKQKQNPTSLPSKYFFVFRKVLLVSPADNMAGA